MANLFEKRHFEWLADYERTNPNFNRAQFLKAAGHSQYQSPPKPQKGT